MTTKPDTDVTADSELIGHLKNMLNAGQMFRPVEVPLPCDCPLAKDPAHSTVKCTPDEDGKGKGVCPECQTEFTFEHVDGKVENVKVDGTLGWPTLTVVRIGRGLIVKLTADARLGEVGEDGTEATLDNLVLRNAIFYSGKCARHWFEDGSQNVLVINEAGEIDGDPHDLFEVIAARYIDHHSHDIRKMFEQSGMRHPSAFLIKTFFPELCSGEVQESNVVKVMRKPVITVGEVSYVEEALPTSTGKTVH